MVSTKNKFLIALSIFLISLSGLTYVVTLDSKLTYTKEVHEYLYENGSLKKIVVEFWEDYDMSSILLGWFVILLLSMLISGVLTLLWGIDIVIGG